jgi:hypothetical protein
MGRPDTGSGTPGVIVSSIRPIRRQQIGSDVADVVRGDAFRQAFLRLEVQRRLSMESPKAVTFRAPTLFCAFDSGGWVLSVQRPFIRSGSIRRPFYKARGSLLGRNTTFS